MNKDLKVEYVSASILNVAKYNPRKHTTEQKDQLKESIKRFGLVDPIICNKAQDRMNIVIGGHFRLKVAKELSELLKCPWCIWTSPTSRRKRN